MLRGLYYFLNIFFGPSKVQERPRIFHDHLVSEARILGRGTTLYPMSCLCSFLPLMSCLCSPLPLCFLLCLCFRSRHRAEAHRVDVLEQSVEKGLGTAQLEVEGLTRSEGLRHILGAPFLEALDHRFERSEDTLEFLEVFVMVT